MDSPENWARLAIMFVAGVLLGALVNWVTSRFAWQTRRYNPWCRWDQGPVERRWYDVIPLLGWFLLRRESGALPNGFWIRPVVVELLMGTIIAALYYWEVIALGLIDGWTTFVEPHFFFTIGSGSALRFDFTWTFLSHAVLATLMMAASLIDFDDFVIPDAITVPGTILGLILAASVPSSLLPVPAPAEGRDRADSAGAVADVHVPSQTVVPLHVGAPRWGAWEAIEQRSTRSLQVAIGILWIWAFCLTPRTWYPRHGYARALQLCCERMRRSASTYLLALFAAGASGLVYFAFVQGGTLWLGLHAAIVGLGVSGGIVWLVRIIGGLALRKEAMGLGDVTLMAMIGTFVGWQSGLLIFFLAPFFGIGWALVAVFVQGRRDLPYGPFLCLATALLVVRWPHFWDWSQSVFAFGWLLPAVLIVAMILLAAMLVLFRTAEDLLRRAGQRGSRAE